MSAEERRKVLQMVQDGKISAEQAASLQSTQETRLAALQQELQAEFDGAPVSLALYMGAQLVRAAEDLIWAPAGTLHRRFLGWLR